MPAAHDPVRAHESELGGDPLTPPPPASATSDLRIPARRHSNLRLGTVRLAMQTAALLGGRRFYRRRYLRPGRFVLREEPIPVPRLPAELEGFTIAQLSDLHAGPFLRGGDLADVVQAVNQRAPDVCVLTGDYITDAWHEALLVLDDLARLDSREGSFAIFGNHDYRGRCEGRIASAFAERGIRFLRGACVRMQRAGSAVALVGLEDLEEAKQGVEPHVARADVRAGDVEVCLCHNPAGGPALARPGCAAVLSGHTHGRQIDLPWVRKQGPPHPGTRVALGPTTLIVNRGLGVIGVPLRYRAPAEVVFARLTRAARHEGATG